MKESFYPFYWILRAPEPWRRRTGYWSLVAGFMVSVFHGFMVTWLKAKG